MFIGSMRSILFFDIMMLGKVDMYFRLVPSLHEGVAVGRFQKERYKTRKIVFPETNPEFSDFHAI